MDKQFNFDSPPKTLAPNLLPCGIGNADGSFASARLMLYRWRGVEFYTQTKPGTLAHIKSAEFADGAVRATVANGDVEVLRSDCFVWMIAPKVDPEQFPNRMPAASLFKRDTQYVRLAPLFAGEDWLGKGVCYMCTTYATWERFIAIARSDDGTFDVMLHNGSVVKVMANSGATLVVYDPKSKWSQA